MLNLMTPDHEGWDKFCDLLEGPEGCNFREEQERGWVWTCSSDHERPLAKAILEKYFPGVDIHGSLSIFQSFGGHCDCEILFNVQDQWEYAYGFCKRKEF